ncbi:MAG TPA: DUF4266 domain-containing protein [Steroidobacteraceae bacterium]|jgi:hypothetical protein
MITRCRVLIERSRQAGHAGGSRPRRARCLTLALLASALGIALSGCSPIEPWVKPYEREHFADPIMAFNRDPVSSVYREHVFESREGARGATGGVGGGCGCN